jgi:hypothetical protein
MNNKKFGWKYIQQQNKKKKAKELLIFWLTGGVN